MYFNPPHIFGMKQDSILPDDIEQEDLENLKRMVEEYFDTRYPDFEPEIVHAMDKDYYLPALKVLVKNKKGFFSPSRVSEWVNGELVAECKTNFLQVRYTLTHSLVDDIFKIEEAKVEPPPYMFSEHQKCDCGIYGTVNIEEVAEYLNKESVVYGGLSGETPKGKPTLCVIEPSPDADAYVCRKGWRASKAFISEIVGETISPNEASQLLSIAWQREIDVRRVFDESR